MSIKLRFGENSSVPVLGTPLLIKNNIYGVKEMAVIGKTYIVSCPKCKRRIYVKAEKENASKFLCRGCQTPILVKGISGNNIQTKEVITERIKKSRRNKLQGKLVWGNLFNRKSYILKEGVSYIGRVDAELPSEVSLKDAYVSRRSVKIETIQGKEGYSFKLTVENATNPVLINGKSLLVGDVVYLNFGDNIVLGNTTITFKEENK